jgi:hypothetical protein
MKAWITQERSFVWKMAVAVAITIVVVTVGEGGVGATFDIQLLVTADVNGKQIQEYALLLEGFIKMFACDQQSIE